MKLTKEQQEEMLEAAKPLIKWLNDNAHPHCCAYVDQTTIQLMEDISVRHTTEFMKG